MDTFLTFTWGAAKGIDLGFFTLRFYSLLFALGFILGFRVMKRIFISENTPLEQLDKLLTYMVVATVVGARLGHVFFYQWDYYSKHPMEILMVWEGGLASHGAAVAIIIALIFYSRKVSKKSVLWILDRVVITVALAGCFIRLGNYANSEIYGKMANSSIETVFTRPTIEALEGYLDGGLASVELEPTGEVLTTDSLTYPEYKITIITTEPQITDKVAERLQTPVKSILSTKDSDKLNFIFPSDSPYPEKVGTTTLVTYGYGVPRYPTQLLEAGGYLLVFMWLFFLFWRTSPKEMIGSLFGQFLVLVFGFRFFIEYYKANQVSFEEGMSLNMGQWLSIPLVLAGLFFIIYPYVRSQKS
jgi:prolipoprotein diacylglyceryltransferase